MHEQEKHFECVFFILEAKYNQLVGILDPANDDDDDDDDDHDDIDIDNDDHIVPYIYRGWLRTVVAVIYIYQGCHQDFKLPDKYNK